MVKMTFFGALFHTSYMFFGTGSPEFEVHLETGSRIMVFLACRSNKSRKTLKNVLKIQFKA